MRFKLIVVSVLLLIAAYSVFWFQIADKVEQDTLAWIEKSKNSADGIKVFVGDLTVSGFPYKIAVEASSINVTLPAGLYNTQSISVMIPEIAVIYQPWKPTHAIVVTDYFDAVIGPLDAPTVNMNFDQVKASVILDPDTFKLDNLSVIAQEINWQKATVNSSMERAELHLRKSLSGLENASTFDLPVNQAVFFKAYNAEINEFKATILGQNADEIVLEAFLHANQLPDFTRSSLSAWRDDGGTLSIKTFEYGTTNNQVDLSGDLTLDESLKPLGAFDAKLSGLENIIGALAQNEGLSDTAKLLLQSQLQNNTEMKDIPISISMQNGMMYVGPIALIELEPIIP
ncbi:MAG: DUF2125 domain-containing protein [Kordiimonadaceae bacterium]|jgi:hypothetical protein|nr:DUF2125 domain-containing protein [Kordiimonadaceae bacterium]MBT6031140.1 DUF2125 domain-containing protein [Kordiimonadaceae bacterium]